jgi:O-antigen ligase
LRPEARTRSGAAGPARNPVRARRAAPSALDPGRIAAALVLLGIATIPFDAAAGLVPGAGVAKAVWALAALGVALSLVLGERRPLPRLPLLAAIAFLSYAGLTYAWSLEPAATAQRVTTLILLALLSFTIVWLASGREERVRAAVAAYVAGALVAAAALAFERARGTGLPSWAMVRLTAFGLDQNDLACSLAIAVALLPALPGRARRPGPGRGPRAGPARRTDIRRGLGVALLALVLGTATLFPGSRAATAGLAVAAVATAYQLLEGVSRPTRLLFVVLLVLALWGTALLVLDRSTLGRIGLVDPSGASYTPTVRARVWRDAWDVFGRRPLFGVGIGSFAAVRERWTGNLARPAHSVFLGVLVEGGVVGLLLLLVVLAAAVAGAIRAPRRLRGPLLAAWAVWLVAASTLTWEFNKATWFLVGLSVAAGTARERVRGARQP